MRVDTDTERRPAAGAPLPPPLYVVIMVAGGWGLHRVYPLRLPDSVVVTASATALALVTVGLLVSAGVALHTRRTPASPWSASKALVTSGIFRYTRNPIYIAFLTAQTAAALWSNIGWWLVLLPVTWLLLDVVQVRREERYLAAMFGDQYLAYTQRVRRWI